jgi:hypothetical protein
MAALPPRPGLGRRRSPDGPRPRAATIVSSRSGLSLLVRRLPVRLGRHSAFVIGALGDIGSAMQVIALA